MFLFCACNIPVDCCALSYCAVYHRKLAQLPRDSQDHYSVGGNMQGCQDIYPTSGILLYCSPVLYKPMRKRLLCRVFTFSRYPSGPLKHFWILLWFCNLKKKALLQIRIEEKAQVLKVEDDKKIQTWTLFFYINFVNYCEAKHDREI